MENASEGQSAFFQPYYSDLIAWAENAGQDHMSPMGMFMAADIIVKAVMVSLVVASVLVWAVFLARLVLLILFRLRLRSNYVALEQAGSLTAAAPLFQKRRGVVGAMIRTALAERKASGAADDNGIKERTDSALSRIEVGAARGMQRGTGLLAIVGSAAPFVGLFGTVWGIMNSFISIAETNTTNLAVVAPGIAEALLATAIGLVAAIPAVIFYNLLARSNAAYKGMLGDAAALVSRTLSRDLDLARVPITTDIPTQRDAAPQTTDPTHTDPALAQAAE